ncbi:L-ascorbate metabolism protein UlaG (beta-lactamase superfamily) [Endobacter medicaginis]|uniref:L-ascorbate metabolism protein UlaG (Beta-lactamase superfamily) n=1 Tax=Endobacter medicaginis TaxID=1181271 RepID=A0A850NXK3_9PROT|nr:MBL fold metallo-hydrolase [Endobacter medicaginis]MBB3172966.1 L-ascorbate metabolism protein UlaG (beta-lactamase superfamily) [Endobacter medicaginis]MCX5476251.1 MBL fold metallo-hydrolase [Endobacter medicaginis]NVN30647.1 MBL fold metallo-hydrolase [Endobacter medicaginis]
MARNPYYSGPVSDHFDGLHFRNPGETNTNRSFAAVLRWRWQTRHQRGAWPDHVAVTPVVPERRVDGLRATPVGHSTVLLQMDGRNILTDPVWSKRAGPFNRIGPVRVAAPAIRLEDLPPIDAVLLSHNHYDHFDVPSLRRLHRDHAPLFVTPLGNDTLLRRHLPDAKIAVRDWGDRIDMAGLAVHLTPALHWSARTLRDRRAALWCGFVIRSQHHGVYYVGDSGYGDGTIFRQIGRDHPGLDLALIPIGAYAPRWFMASAHVDPQDAVRIFTDCGAAHAMGVHWGTFRLSDEAYDAPAQELHASLVEEGLPPDRFLPARAGLSRDF